MASWSFDDRAQRRTRPLFVLVLDDGLDHPIAIGDRLEVVDAAQPSDRLVGGGRLELAALDPASERALDAPRGGLGRRLADLDQGDVEPGPDADLGDPRPHDPAADDPDPLGRHLLGPRAQRNAWMPVSAPPITSAWTSAVPS